MKKSMVFLVSLVTVQPFLYAMDDDGERQALLNHVSLSFPQPQNQQHMILQPNKNSQEVIIDAHALEAQSSLELQIQTLQRQLHYANNTIEINQKNYEVRSAWALCMYLSAIGGSVLGGVGIGYLLYPYL